ncbi:MAG: hypothetical protein GEU73_07700 [Chloroflexi bacterium]|nr:hypothetical protein [Chloroflexota bacterium]
MTLFTKRFLLDALERSIKTAAQAAVAVIGGDLINAFDLAYLDMAGIALGAALVSVLTSIASAQVGDDSPSLLRRA